MKWIKILMVIAFAAINQGAIADVTGDFLAPKSSDQKGVLSLTISKSITPKDYTDMANLATMIDKRHGDKWLLMADLNTTGGNVEAALKIGSFFRKKDALASVPNGSICMSSCVYVLAGATHRSVEGVVGIHRPYEPDDNTISEVAQKVKYQKLGTQITAFLRNVNIPARLYEDSLFISPDRVKILSADELQAYGLNENDPFVDEADAVKSAKKSGISRKEYGQREIRARQTCKSIAATTQSTQEEMSAYIKCKSDILDGTH